MPAGPACLPTTVILPSIKIKSYTGFQPLRTCMLGRSYPPEFYSKIPNSKVRSVMERLAAETEEDYQSLEKVLKSFDITVYRPDIFAHNDFAEYMLLVNGQERYQVPPMNPRDNLLVYGNTMLVDRPWGKSYVDFYDGLLARIDGQIYHSRDSADLRGIGMPGITRVGTTVFCDQAAPQDVIARYLPEAHCRSVPIGSHSDSVFCPVTPGLIVSTVNVESYADTFPDWEVVYVPDTRWQDMRPFLELRKKNRGRWWIPGQETNDDLIDYVNTWYAHWLGYVEETVFDVNMLVIDEKNVICTRENPQVFEAFRRHDVTPHVVNFRHRFFWDGGLHCISLDLERHGEQIDYFRCVQYHQDPGQAA